MGLLVLHVEHAVAAHQPVPTLDESGGGASVDGGGGCSLIDDSGIVGEAAAQSNSMSTISHLLRHS